QRYIRGVMPAGPRLGAAALAELIIGPSRDILYTLARHQRWFRVEGPSDQACRKHAEPRRAGSARHAGAWGGRFPARRHLYGKSGVQAGWFGPRRFAREDHAARYRF